ncbi:hemolysins and related proteins containing CBSdomains [Nonlabens ulvanivorans]|uniref:Hemolysins and related proteins containing CBSdomains n=1 Tax=Nonlabens ulvanivorans TaxID=906888 RepID=A0A081D6N3_NONUL|nr:gliding motility-associated protein GldE [Nonlabens ulvanivorans]GAK74579.1 hemolysins and related proteins containing CBSdomains [Nonlabens ulvanivorans]
MDPDSSHLLFAILSGSSELVYFLVFIILLILSAMVSGAEVALFSLETIDLEDEHVDFPRRELVAKLLARPKKLLATILIANNAINITTVLIFSILADSWLDSIDAEWLRFVLEVVIATFLILLFGEILPKVYANRNAMQFANFMAIPLNILDKLFSFLSLPMRYVTIQIHERLGNKKSSITVSQLSQALELTDHHDTTDEEQQLLQGIVSFGNTDTKTVMRNRTDVFALDESLPFKDIITEVISNGYSRIPVFKESIDQITGVLYVKDLLPYIDRKNFEWTKLLREVYFVPENKKLDDLLQEFQEQKKHLAIVVDEYGGTSGLISLEDIIEEIVGDISDEFDDENLVYSKLDDKNFVFEGKTPLKDFYRITELEESEQELFDNSKGESETVAGFLLEQTGYFPRKLDKITFEGFTFVVESMDKKRIKQVKCTKP